MFLDRPVLTREPDTVAALMLTLPTLTNARSLTGLLTNSAGRGTKRPRPVDVSYALFEPGVRWGVREVPRHGAVTCPGRRRMSGSPADITRLLHAAANGDRRDADALMSAIYEDLRRLAVAQMRGERRDHTLQPTALAHEAYIKLIGQHSVDWKDRSHFFSVASRLIRRILVDHAREKHAQKRGGGFDRATLDDRDIAAPEHDVDLLALDEALTMLAEIHPRQAEIVELRYFGGLTIEEIAELLGVGKRSVDRDWGIAKAWLYCQLSDDPEGDGDAA